MPHPSVTARSDPRSTAIIVDATGEHVTYAQLDARANQGAHLFRKLGLIPGDRIALLMDNNREYLEIVWAAQRSGLTFVPISARYDDSELQHVLANCGARVLLVSPQRAETAERVLCGPSHIEQCFIIGGERGGFRSWTQAAALQPETPIADECNGVPLYYTSGTTGRPKGVVFVRQSEDINIAPAGVSSLGASLGFDATTVYLCPSPLCYATALQFCLMTHYLGGCVVLMERFDAERVLKLIEQHRVTHSQFIPLMFAELLKLPVALRESYDVSSLRMAAHAGAPCPADIKEHIIDWWGDVVWEYYFCAEGSGVTLINAAAWRRHRGSVGRAVLGELHILDAQGQPLPPGAEGMVYFSGDQLRFRYEGDPSATAHAFSRDGWANTGDLGYLDADGYLYLTGRQGAAVVHDGVSVQPGAVESALLSHPKVADAVMFGTPGRDGGEDIRVLVQPRVWSEASAETALELLAWLRDRLPAERMPQSLDFHPKLPLRDNGVVYAADLRDYRRPPPLRAPQTPPGDWKR